MSRLFIPNLSNQMSFADAEDDSKNYKLLLSSGFVVPSQSGMFHFLPLGLRVLKKLNHLIKLQMESIDAQEVLLSSVTAAHLWKQSGRWDSAGEELYRLKDRRDRDLCLSPTFEESITSLISKQYLSSKDLPLKLFQISNKFRDEMLSRNGLLRSRDFVMKDLYSFDSSAAAAEETYSQVCAAYQRIFASLGLDAVKVSGATGKIGGKFSHEFQVPCAAGEDEIRFCQSCRCGANLETLQSGEEWHCGCDDARVVTTNSIEVAHTFLLGQKYSAVFKASFHSSAGVSPLLEMGCFGVGVSRLMAAIVEVSHPATNSPLEIVWPQAVAPFTVAVILPKKGSKEETSSVVGDALKVYDFLNGGPFLADVVLDDRTEATIGRRLVDMKRIGIPWVVVAGRRLKTEQLFEVVDVHRNETRFLTHDDVNQFLASVSSVGEESMRAKQHHPHASPHASPHAKR